MAILENIVKIIMLKLAIILVYLYDSFRPIFICKIFDKGINERGNIFGYDKRTEKKQPNRHNKKRLG